MKENVKYMLFSCCLMTKGAQRSVIIDTQRSVFYTIPTALHTILSENKVFTFTSLLKKYGSQSILKEYFTFLLDNEIIFELGGCTKLNFPKLKMHWNFPAKIANGIFIVSDKLLKYTLLINEINELHLSYLELWISASFNDKNIIDFINSLNNTSLHYVTINIEYKFYSEDLINNLCTQKIVFKIYVFGTQGNIVHNKCIAINEGNVGKQYCGLVSKGLFAPNLLHFTESQHHNTCLNRKISIDANGEIKNCPSMAKSYGNIRDTKLIDVVNNPEFQKVWHIKKDEITKCKDCEFRHICTDCRAYLENPEDQYSAPLKCGYNPYTCEWEEWSTNPLKEKAIAFYGMEELVKNEKGKVKNEK